MHAAIQVVYCVISISFQQARTTSFQVNNKVILSGISVFTLVKQGYINKTAFPWNLPIPGIISFIVPFHILVTSIWNICYLNWFEQLLVVLEGIYLRYGPWCLVSASFNVVNINQASCAQNAWLTCAQITWVSCIKLHETTSPSSIWWL